MSGGKGDAGTGGSIEALLQRLHLALEVTERNLRYHKGQRPLGWVELVNTVGQLAALLTRRDRYENAQCVTCGKDLDTEEETRALTRRDQPEPTPKDYGIYSPEVERELSENYTSATRRDADPAKEPGWQPIETAPKGSGPEGPADVRHPDYVAPPHVWLTLPDGQRCVGSWDWYYADGGHGYDGDSAWVEEFSGERVRPTHWMLLPAPPVAAKEPGE